MRGKAAVVLTFAALLATADAVATAGDAPRAVDAIENDLVADDAAVRAKAAAELTDRFPDGAVAVPMLVDLLDDESPDVVAAAAKAIDVMAAPAAMQLAVWCADDKRLDPKTRFGDELPTLLSLKDPTAADAIDLEEVRANKTPPDVPVLAALLPQRPSSSSTFPLLLRIWRGSPAPTRATAAAALALRGADAVADRGVVPQTSSARTAAAGAAITLVRSDSEARAWMGCRLLARLRPSDPAAVSALSDAMSAAKKPVKRHAQEIRVVRHAAIVALGRLGPAAASASAPLLTAAAKPDGEFGEPEECVRALLRMGKEQDVLALLASKPPTADDVVGALAKEHRAAATLVPLLVAKLEHDGFDLDAVQGLRALGTDAAAAGPLLEKLCRSADDPRPKIMFLDAALAVSSADPKTQKLADAVAADPAVAKECPGEVLDLLAKRAAPTQALADRLAAAVAQAAAAKPEDYFAPTVAVQGLGRCGPLAKAAVPDLLRVLAVEDKRTADPRMGQSSGNRLAVVVTLGRIGPGAATAVPALTALRDKGDETIRVPAAQALRLIRAKK